MQGRVRTKGRREQQMRISTTSWLYAREGLDKETQGATGEDINYIGGGTVVCKGGSGQRDTASNRGGYQLHWGRHGCMQGRVRTKGHREQQRRISTTLGEAWLYAREGQDKQTQGATEEGINYIVGGMVVCKGGSGQRDTGRNRGGYQLHWGRHGCMQGRVKTKGHREQQRRISTTLGEAWLYAREGQDKQTQGATEEDINYIGGGMVVCKGGSGQRDTGSNRGGYQLHWGRHGCMQGRVRTNGHREQQRRISTTLGEAWLYAREGQDKGTQGATEEDINYIGGAQAWLYARDGQDKRTQGATEEDINYIGGGMVVCKGGSGQTDTGSNRGGYQLHWGSHGCMQGRVRTKGHREQQRRISTTLGELRHGCMQGMVRTNGHREQQGRISTTLGEAWLHAREGQDKQTQGATEEDINYIGGGMVVCKGGSGQRDTGSTRGGYQLHWGRNGCMQGRVRTNGHREQQRRISTTLGEPWLYAREGQDKGTQGATEEDINYIGGAQAWLYARDGQDKRTQGATEEDINYIGGAQAWLYAREGQDKGTQGATEEDINYIGGGMVVCKGGSGQTDTGSNRGGYQLHWGSHGCMQGRVRTKGHREQQRRISTTLGELRHGCMQGMVRTNGHREQQGRISTTLGEAWLHAREGQDKQTQGATEEDINYIGGGMVVCKGGSGQTDTGSNRGGYQLHWGRNGCMQGRVRTNGHREQQRRISTTLWEAWLYAREGQDKRTQGATGEDINYIEGGMVVCKEGQDKGTQGATKEDINYIVGGMVVCKGGSGQRDAGSNRGGYQLHWGRHGCMQGRVRTKGHREQQRRISTTLGEAWLYAREGQDKQTQGATEEDINYIGGGMVVCKGGSRQTDTGSNRGGYQLHWGRHGCMQGRVRTNGHAGSNRGGYQLHWGRHGCMQGRVRTNGHREQQRRISTTLGEAWLYAREGQDKGTQGATEEDTNYIGGGMVVCKGGSGQRDAGSNRGGYQLHLGRHGCMQGRVRTKGRREQQRRISTTLGEAWLYAREGQDKRTQGATEEDINYIGGGMVVCKGGSGQRDTASNRGGYQLHWGRHGCMQGRVRTKGRREQQRRISTTLGEAWLYAREGQDKGTQGVTEEDINYIGGGMVVCKGGWSGQTDTGSNRGGYQLHWGRHGCMQGRVRTKGHSEQQRRISTTLGEPWLYAREGQDKRTQGATEEDINYIMVVCKGGSGQRDTASNRGGYQLHWGSHGCMQGRVRTKGHREQQRRISTTLGELRHGCMQGRVRTKGHTEQQGRISTTLGEEWLYARDGQDKRTQGATGEDINYIGGAQAWLYARDGQDKRTQGATEEDINYIGGGMVVCKGGSGQTDTGSNRGGYQLHWGRNGCMQGRVKTKGHAGSNRGGYQLHWGRHDCMQGRVKTKGHREQQRRISTTLWEAWLYAREGQDKGTRREQQRRISTTLGEA